MTRPNQTAEEVDVFKAFSMHYPIALSMIVSRNPPEPDILCTTVSGSQRAFEIVEIIDQQLASADQGMLRLKGEVEQSFDSLNATEKAKLQTVLPDASVFVRYAGNATLQHRRAAIPVIFQCLAGLSPTSVGKFDKTSFGVTIPFVETLRIFRGNFNGPSWNVANSGLLSDPTIDRLADKFGKQYSSDAESIELLAYFHTQPKPRSDLLEAIEVFIRNNIQDSPFSAVWLYSLPIDKLILTIEGERGHGS